ncbi:hypothetical protein [Thalassotalea ganghwensis]
MKECKKHDNFKTKRLLSSFALLIGFTLSVGPSINSYGAAFCIALPISIALYVGMKKEK